jgi:hypothetical protein
MQNDLISQKNSRKLVKTVGRMIKGILTNHILTIVFCDINHNKGFTSAKLNGTGSNLGRI